MRRIRFNITPSLEEDATESQLEKALRDEKAANTQVEEDLTTPLNNQNGFEAEVDPAATDEDTLPPVEAAPEISTDETVVVPEVDAATDAATPPVADVNSTASNVTDPIAESVVSEAAGEANDGVRAFIDKMKDSYSLAQTNGFEGTFDEFLQSVTDSITQKESEVAQNPLGTTSGSGEVTEIPSDQAAVVDTVETTDTGLPATTDETALDTPPTEGDTNLNGEPVNDSDPTAQAENETQVEAETVPEPTGGDDESLNEFIDQVDDDQEEKDNTDEMVEEAVDSSTRLGRIAEIVQDAIQEAKDTGEETNVDESIAKIAEIANESYCKHYGIRQKYSAMVSNEAFRGSLQSNVRAEIALEAIGETLTQIKEAILKAIEAAAQWFADQFRKFQLNFGFLEKSLAKLEQRLEKADGTPKEREFVNDRLYSVLEVDGLVNNPVIELNKLTALASSIYGEINTWTVKMGESVLGGGGIKIDSFANLTPHFSGIRFQAVSSPVKEGLVTEKNFTKAPMLYAKSEILPGNKCLVLAVPDQRSAKFGSGDTENFKEMAKLLSSPDYGVRLKDAHKNVTGKRDNKLNYLIKEEMGPAIKAIKSLLEGIKAYNKASAEIKSARAKIKANVKMGKLSTAVGGAVNRVLDNKEVEKSLAGENMALATYVTISRNLSEPAAAFTSYTLRLIAAYSSYVNASLAQYESKESSAPSGASSNPTLAPA